MTTEIPIEISSYENYAMLRASHKQRKEKLFARHKEIRKQVEAEFRRRIEEVNNECQRDTHQLNFVLAKEEATWRKNKTATAKPTGSVSAKKRKADQDVDEIERILGNDYPPTPFNSQENRNSEGNNSNLAKRPCKSIMDVARKQSDAALSTAVIKSPQQKQQFTLPGIIEMADNMRTTPLLLSDDDPEIHFVGRSSSPNTCQQPMHMIKDEPVSPQPDNYLEQVI